MATDPNQDNTVKPSPVAPVLTVQTGGDALAPGQELAPRKVVGAAPSLGTIPASEASLISPTRMYTGQYLVDKDGMIARPQYSTSEAYAELAGLGDTSKRRAFLNRLYALGVYGKSRPTVTGFASRDQNAMAQAMLYANANGVTVDVALTMMAADPNIQANIKAVGVSSRARVRTTPTQDLRAVFKQASQNILGRDLSDDEVDKFVRSYNASEVREARGGVAAPTPGTAAQEAVRGAAPVEAGAMGMLRLAEIMDQSLKGIG